METTMLFVTLTFVLIPCVMSTVTFHFLEQLPVGTLVGNIPSAKKLSANYSSQELSSFRYNFLSENANTAYFTLDSVKGDLKSDAEIDREIICGLSLTCNLNFDVSVKTASDVFITVISVKVVIDDKNDNDPIFPEAQMSLSVREDESVGQTFSLKTAQDRDVGINSVQSYEILPQNGTFGLKITKKLDGNFLVKLKLNKELDREKQNSYVFHVMAKDGGSPPHVGTLKVVIGILDANDNKPVFSQSLYNISVKEDVTINTSILNLVATDRDIGKNGQVFYRFSPQQSNLAEIQKIFSINEATGDLTVIGKLHYSQEISYNFYVDASDSGDEPQVSQAEVLIRILDTGNNAPIMHVSFLKPAKNGKVNVSESSKVNTSVIHIKVEDTDTGDNGKVDCAVNDTHFELQSVPGGLGIVMVIKSRLDRETMDQIFIRITCTDRGTPVKSSFKNYEIHVTDENDKTPKFKKDFYHASLAENNGIGDVITQVSAEDGDIGRNAFILYFIYPTDTQNFAINSKTGVVTASTRFDREKNNVVTFRVLAVDSGNPPLTGTASVILNITDKNDNPPSFNVSSFQFYVLENKPIGTVAGHLTAMDLDSGDNGRVSFSLYGSSNSSFPFVIFPTGIIKTTQVLDREKQKEYHFKVIASDHGEPQMRSLVHVTVLVRDDNDHSPVILFPNDSNATAAIPYLAPIGTLITTIEAKDLDTGLNSELIYTIEAGNDKQIFDLDANTGRLTLKSTLIIKEDKVIPLMISVKDRGTPQQKAHHHLHIVLKYANMTAISPLKAETGSKYIVISAVVIVFTLVISAVIVTIICLLRRSDNRKAAQYNRSQLHNEAMYQVKDTNLYQSDENFNSTGELSKKKKKEVSFSLDEDLDSPFDMSVFGDKPDSEVGIFIYMLYIQCI